MSSPSPRSNLSRRTFLKLTVAAGVTVAGAHMLDTYAPTLKRSLRRPVDQVLI